MLSLGLTLPGSICCPAAKPALSSEPLRNTRLQAAGGGSQDEAGKSENVTAKVVPTNRSMRMSGAAGGAFAEAGAREEQAGGAGDGAGGSGGRGTKAKGSAASAMNDWLHTVPGRLRLGTTTTPLWLSQKSKYLGNWENKKNNI